MPFNLFQNNIHKNAHRLRATESVDVNNGGITNTLYRYRHRRRSQRRHIQVELFVVNKFVWANSIHSFTLANERMESKFATLTPIEKSVIISPTNLPTNNMIFSLHSDQSSCHFALRLIERPHVLLSFELTSHLNFERVCYNGFELFRCARSNLAQSF